MWPVPCCAVEDPNGAHSTLDIGGRTGDEEGVLLLHAHIGGYCSSKEGLEQRRDKLKQVNTSMTELHKSHRVVSRSQILSSASAIAQPPTALRYSRSGERV